jgi:hypothetical protein
MDHMGAEETALVGVLTADEREVMKALLKRLALAAEASSGTPSAVSGTSQATSASSDA